MNIILPPPDTMRERRVYPKQRTDVVKCLNFNSIMKSIEPGHKVRIIVHLHRLVFIAHQRFVFPIGSINCCLQAASLSHSSIPELGKIIILILCLKRDIIIAGGEKDIRIGSTAVESSV